MSVSRVKCFFGPSFQTLRDLFVSLLFTLVTHHGDVFLRGYFKLAVESQNARNTEQIITMTEKSIELDFPFQGSAWKYWSGALASTWLTPAASHPLCRTERSAWEYNPPPAAANPQLSVRGNREITPIMHPDYQLRR